MTLVATVGRLRQLPVIFYTYRRDVITHVTEAEEIHQLKRFINSVAMDSTLIFHKNTK